MEDVYSAGKSATDPGGDSLHDTVQKSSISSPTGIAELDVLLGGGFPKGAIVLLSGSSGSGKTNLSFHWLFEGVKNNENSVYITLTEPLFKIVENLERMSFYDRDALEQERLKIIDLRRIYEDEGFNPEETICSIEEYVKQANAKRLCIDSITAIAYNLDKKSEIRKFIFELGKTLSALGCTTVLISEVGDPDKFSVYGVEEFISDAILRLDQVRVRDELHRIMRIVKVRGRGYRSEDIYFKISDQGFRVFPKLRIPLEYSSTTEKISTGIPVLDEMFHGGIFRGSSTLVAGSTGTGKSLSCLGLIMDGLRNGEPCLYAGFEESRDQLIRNAEGFGWDLGGYEKKGLLVLRCVYPNEMLPEEHLSDIKRIVEENKISRCAVDSLSSISNSFPEDTFLGFTKRLGGYLKTRNVTAFFTSATASLVGTTTLTDVHFSTQTDNILMLRYVEMEGELKKVLNVIKVRGSSHSKVLRRYEITGEGIVLGESLSGYEGVMSGLTRKVSETVEEKIESEFKRFIGPMANSVFLEMKRTGLTKENILQYIDELTSQKILRKENARIFRQNIADIMGSHASAGDENPDPGSPALEEDLGDRGGGEKSLQGRLVGER